MESSRFKVPVKWNKIMTRIKTSKNIFRKVIIMSKRTTGLCSPFRVNRWENILIQWSFHRLKGKDSHEMANIYISMPCDSNSVIHLILNLTVTLTIFTMFKSSINFTNMIVARVLLLISLFQKLNFKRSLSTHSFYNTLHPEKRISTYLIKSLHYFRSS